MSNKEEKEQEKTDLPVKDENSKEIKNDTERKIKSKLKHENKKEDDFIGEECVNECLSCKEFQAKAEEYKNHLKITLADFDNHRKRTATLIKDAKANGEVEIIKKFLPALDIFAKAKEMTSDKQLCKGIEMIEKEIKRSLKEIGVNEVHCLGKKLDPQYHNAISISHNNEIEDDIITNVFQAGYTYNDKVIRYAQVIINKKGEQK